jgi:hypothetical protein
MITSKGIKFKPKIILLGSGCNYRIIIPLSYLCRMLTDEEKSFIRYWEENRLRKKKIWRQLSVGLPLGAALAGAILVSIYSEWNPAGAALKFNPGRMFIVLAGVLLVVVFIVIFSARHRWDQNEQHYKELLVKRSKE